MAIGRNEGENSAEKEIRRANCDALVGILEHYNDHIDEALKIDIRPSVYEEEMDDLLVEDVDIEIHNVPDAKRRRELVHEIARFALGIDPNAQIDNRTFGTMLKITVAY